MKNISPRLRKILIAVVIFFASYTLLGFVILPPIARSVIQKELSASLHRQTTLRKVYINPYTFHVVLKGLTVREKEGAKTFASFARLSVSIQPVSIFRKGIIIKNVSLDKPYLRIIRNKEHSYNVSDLISKKASQKKEPFQFLVNSVRISDGTLEFEDMPKGKEHRITDIMLVVPFVSDHPHYTKTFVRPELSGKIDGSPFDFTGKTQPFSESHETLFNINIQDLNLPYYASYLPMKPGIALKSGRARTKLILSYIQYESREPSISLKGSVELSDIDLTDKQGKPMIEVPRLAVDIAEADLLSRKMHISDVTIDSPSLSIKRDSKGTINLLSLMPPSGAEITSSASPGKKKSPFSVDVGSFSLTGGKVEFSDSLQRSDAVSSMRTKPAKFAVDNLKISAKNISTVKDTESSLSISGNLGKGRFDISGSASLNPVMLKLKTDVRKLDILPFQPYLAGRINIGITGGKAYASGDMSLKTVSKGKYDISYKGDAEVSDFSSVDRINYRRLLKWASLRLEGIKTTGNFQQISVKGVSLSQFYARVIVQPDGTLNVMHILNKEKAVSGPSGSKKAEEKGKPASSQSGGRNITIGTTTLEGGTIDFTDLHIKPRYSAKLTGVAGRVSTLSSTNPSPADVDLLGKWNNFAPLEITGKVNPFGKDLFVDLSLNFKNMDLSPLTPFSNKYIGYSIEKGKLGLKLKYRIVKRKLNAENLVSLDQLTLGRKVESPDAVRLPIKFAISLLKDREGMINLNVPVTGSLDDPQFSLGHIILKAIGRLIMKIITSPFRLIASLFGGGNGGKLSYLEFNYGSSSLSPENVSKLGMLMKALYERPNLELDIAGYVNPEKDRDSLRQIRFQMKLKKRALLDMEDKGKKPVPLDQVEIKPEDYNRILWEVYKKEKFPRPTNFFGFVKKLPPAEMEKLILTHIIITDDDLRQLAHDRARAARSYILNAKVNPDRVFLVESKSLTPKKKKDLKESRVDFTLK